MPTPKRKHSKGRTRRKRSEKLRTKAVKVVKTKDKKGYKRPHVDEYVEV